MSMTNKFRVTFEVDSYLSDSDVKEIEDTLIEFSKEVGHGDVEPDSMQRETLVAFLTRGMRGIVALHILNMVAGSLQELREDTMGLEISEPTIQEINHE